MSLVASWRTALRIARREARRSRGRSALVIAMIALPVLCLSFAAVSYDMMTLTGAERADRTMGAAEARIQWPMRWEVQQHPDPYEGGYGTAHGGPPPVGGGEADERDKPGTEAELLAKLPAGSTILPLRRGAATLRTVDGIGQPNAVMVDATSPLTRGYVEVLSGRAPSAVGEVALTKQAMERLGAGTGGTVVNAVNGRTYTVVGEVEFPSLLDQVVLFAPNPEPNPDGFSFNEFSWLAQTPAPITWAEVLRLNQSGIVVASRAVYENPPPDDQVPWLLEQGGIRTEELAVLVLIAGLALLEIVLLAGPAFAVSARRRQRQLALVAANGGTPAHVRRIVLADGVVLGLVGAGVGIVAGIAGAFIGRPWVEELLANERGGAYRVFPSALAAIAALAVVTGVLAALVPAFITARRSVVASLAGRRGVTRSRKRWLAVGVGMVALGGAIAVAGTSQVNATVILAGLVVGELGLVLCTPSLVGLIARAGRILPLTPRIALRDAARNRAAAAPAISAVMAAVAGSVALGLFLDSSHTRDRAFHQQSMPTGTVQVYFGYGDPTDTPSTSAIEQAVRSTLPVTDVHPIGSVICPPGGTAEERYGCMMQPVPHDECPQLKKMRDGVGELSIEERRAAETDPRCDRRLLYSGYGGVVDDGTALATLSGATGDELARAQATLRAGGIVVRHPSLIKDGVVTVSIARPKADGSADTTERPAIKPGSPFGGDPHLSVTTMTFTGYLLAANVGSGSTVYSPGAVAKAGLSTAVSSLVASTTRMPTQKEEDRAAAATQPLEAFVQVEHGLTLETDPRLLLLIAASVAITLGAAGVGTGLAAADSRADLSTLAAVGASPRVRRGLSLSQSGVIAGLGSVLGALAGLGAAVAVITALNQSDEILWPGPGPLPIVAPWLALLVALVITPLVAILGAGLFTRSRLPIERRL
jgi:putative ABC transport system permease protein